REERGALSVGCLVWLRSGVSPPAAKAAKPHPPATTTDHVGTGALARPVERSSTAPPEPARDAAELRSAWTLRLRSGLASEAAVPEWSVAVPSCAASARPDSVSRFRR